MTGAVLSLVLLLAAGVTLGCVFYGRVLSHLRDRHAETWTGLGRPSLSPRSLLSDRPRMQRFLWAREFEPIGDPALSRRCEALRWFLVLWSFTLPVTVLLVSR